ncbi:MAG: alpha/beta hydrolase [Candidatus Aureabacteria bacterium]|nr:alpha/beta hydrolase [Candidatus Auribacterota bacterium]
MISKIKQKTVRSKDAHLWAIRDGNQDSPCIILVAGANASHLMWPQEFADLLVDRGFCVLRYDHRDTGKSSKFDISRCPYTLQDLSEDILAVLDGFEVKRTHAVGLSMGGTLVQAAVLDHPSRFLSATVMLTAALDVDFTGNISRAYTGEPNPLGLPSPERKVLDVLAKRMDEAKTLDDELEKRTTEWLALSGNKAEVKPEEFRNWEARAIAHAGSMAQPKNHALIAPIPLVRGKELSTIQIPFLVIQGGQDPLNPPPHGKHLAQLIPSSTYVEIQELGHSLPSSLHAVIAEKICAHIAGSNRSRLNHSFPGTAFRNL